MLETEKTPYYVHMNHRMGKLKVVKIGLLLLFCL